jgi:hypothetical protein
MGKMTRIQERQREEIISRMLQDGYDIQQIAEHPQVDMLSHNLRRKIRKMRERGILGTASYFQDASELKTIEKELGRIAEEIDTYAKELRQEGLSNNRKNEISRHLSALRRVQQRYIQEKRRLISAPTQKFDPVIKDRETWSETEERLISQVMEYNNCTKSEAYKLVDEAAVRIAELLDEERLNSDTGDKPKSLYRKPIESELYI